MRKALAIILMGFLLGVPTVVLAAKVTAVPASVAKKYSLDSKWYKKYLLVRANLREDRYGRRRDSKSLRHYFIQMCLARGNDIWDVSQQVGTSPQAIKDHYSRGYKASPYKEVMVDTKAISVD